MARAETACPVLNVHSEGLTAPTAFLEMLATILQMPKRFFFACKIVADAKNYFFPFARLLQTPKRFFFACKIVASAKKFFFPFARLLQAPKLHFSICKIVATTNKSFPAPYFP